MARHPGIVITALSWNLFHGRDSTGAGLRRPLLGEFVTVLGREQWDIGLFQEAPPRWFDTLHDRFEAEGVCVHTSRNWGSPVRGFIADRWPDLIKSNEGGSNQLFMRKRLPITGTDTLTLARWPERRRAMLVQVDFFGAKLKVVNLHASANRPDAAARELLHAAAWAGDGPLLFGGDFNVRPAVQPQVFDELRERFGLGQPTAPDAIDHLLVRDLDIVEPPVQLEPARREVNTGDGRVRLSDHAPVVARFAMK